MTPNIIALIASTLRLEWSPEQISGWLLEYKQASISHESIYFHVWADKKTGGDLYTYLRRQGKSTTSAVTGNRREVR